MENEAKYTGVRKSKGGKFYALIKDPFTKRRVRLGTFNTAEEASNAYLLRKQVFLATPPSVNKRFNSNMDFTTGKEPFISVESSCSMANVHGTESSSGCISTTVTSNPKAKRNLLGLGVRRRKSGRFSARIKDPISHKRVWLGTFDTVEEASEAYFSKKSEFEKLSKGIKENKPKHCDQIQPESPVGASLSVDIDHTLNVTSVGGNKTISSHETTHFVGVRKRKSGRFSSEIKNPISKKRIYLGTFDSAEEASQAYQSKKLEFKKLVEAKQQCNRQTHSSALVEQDGKEKLVHAKQGHETVTCEGFQPESSRGASFSEIEVPVSNSSSGGSDRRIDSNIISHSLGVQKRNSGKSTSGILSGTVGTAEEAFSAYQCKRTKKAELQSDMPTDSSAGENQEGEDLWKGKWVQLPGNKEVNISLKLGVPIIDNYGSLLGEFRSLDDLRIVKH